MKTRRDFLIQGASGAAGFLATSSLARQSSAAEETAVGVLIPGSIHDQGYMESAYLGLKAIEGKLGRKLKASLIENINYADMEQAFVTLASRNRLVVAASGASQSAMIKVAPRFPGVTFALVGGAKLKDPIPNMSQYDTRQAEIAFVAGAAAAMLTRSGVVNYVGGLEIPGIKNAGQEFGHGAKYINPNIKSIQMFLGSFDDVAKGKEATLAAAAQGADIHYHALNHARRGMEQAAKEKGTKIIGAIFNRCGEDNPQYVGYSVTNIGFALAYAVESFLAGSWQPGSKKFGLAMGPDAADMVVCKATPEMVAKLQQIKQDIVNGKIDVLDG